MDRHTIRIFYRWKIKYPFIIWFERIFLSSEKTQKALEEDAIKTIKSMENYYGRT